MKRLFLAISLACVSTQLSAKETTLVIPNGYLVEDMVLKYDSNIISKNDLWLVATLYVDLSQRTSPPQNPIDSASGVERPPLYQLYQPDCQSPYAKDPKAVIREDLEAAR